MAEGTKDLSTNMQQAAGIKTDHQFLALDPDTGMVVGVKPEQLPGSVSLASIPTSSDDTFDII